jgi:hypothetical protein
MHISIGIADDVKCVKHRHEHAVSSLHESKAEVELLGVLWCFKYLLGKFGYFSATIRIVGVVIAT